MKGIATRVHWYVNAREESRFNIRHVLREGNKCADWLATWALGGAIGETILEEPPGALHPLLLHNKLGVSTPWVMAIRAWFTFVLHCIQKKRRKEDGITSRLLVLGPPIEDTSPYYNLVLKRQGPVKVTMPCGAWLWCTKASSFPIPICILVDVPTPNPSLNFKKLSFSVSVPVPI